MERYESLSATNIWKKYSSRKPIIVFIAEDDELCNKLLSKLSAFAFEINNLRFTTFDRMRKPLYSPGAMLKVGKEGNIDTLIPVSSPYLEKGTEEAEEKSE